MSGLSAREADASARAAAANDAKENEIKKPGNTVVVITDERHGELNREKKAELKHKENIFLHLQHAILPIVEKTVGDKYLSTLVAKRIVQTTSRISEKALSSRSSSELASLYDSMVKKKSSNSTPRPNEELWSFWRSSLVDAALPSDLGQTHVWEGARKVVVSDENWSNCQVAILEAWIIYSGPGQRQLDSVRARLEAGTMNDASRKEYEAGGYETIFRQEDLRAQTEEELEAPAKAAWEERVKQEEDAYSKARYDAHEAMMKANRMGTAPRVYVDPFTKKTITA